MANIHPLATVHPKAKLGENVEVGPYAYIEEHVEIGDGSKILPHATIFNYVKMGKNCSVFPGAVVGAIPQDLKFDGEVTYVEIGDNENFIFALLTHSEQTSTILFTRPSVILSKVALVNVFTKWAGTPSIAVI